MAEAPKAYQQFVTQYPAVGAAYEQLGDAAMAAGPLDRKVQRLIKLGMAIAARQQGGTHAQVRAALKQGATKEELYQVALLGITTLGFPAANTGMCWIRDVLEPNEG
ncbi:MAG: carboxymuconolactone decarboxylase family protein [Cyanobacteria bacterium NC_groundwater_1444_Ag_S-0.65um_54_12]|nr:carboxymuconolactone decarboxylase family protein [Cyanobacteria bacterium NC_groundwater_1444_Ag_S-0.65um_54_12]